MESLVDVSNSNYKKSLEYLFYGVDPTAPQEIYHIIEEGFRQAPENKSNGAGGYSALVNSILGADLARLNYFMKYPKNMEKFGKRFIKKKFPQGMIVFPPG